jgi:hypothetical protein
VTRTRDWTVGAERVGRLRDGLPGGGADGDRGVLASGLSGILEWNCAVTAQWVLQRQPAERRRPVDWQFASNCHSARSPRPIRPLL